MKTVSICTLGCRVNQYESRAIAELFIKQGYTVMDFGKECDVCIVNTCAVTAESERKSAQMIRRAAKLAKDVRVCGCFAERKGDIAEDFPFITKKVGCNGKTALADIVPSFTDKGFEKAEIATVPSKDVKQFSSARAFVKIQDGCMGKCTYCIIPSLRGKVRSRPYEEIVAEVERLITNGCKEIVLTGIETAAYNYEPLPKLLQRVAKVEGIKRLRLGSLDPNALNESFIKTAAELPILMPHFHISLQSGCDRILKLMRRPYTADDAKRRILALKEAVPNVQLSADIICSFPTESYEELEKTLGFLKEIGFSHIHAFSYSKRPGTPAAEMEGQIPEDEKKRRMHHFLTECLKMENDIRSARIGSTDTVLVEKAENVVAFGHTEDFLEAKIKTSHPHLEGDLLEVIITGTDGEYLECEER